MSSPPGRALFTDLYELTMLQAYFEAGLSGEAVFSLYVRELPLERNYYLAAGLEDALSYLETLRFAEEDVSYLRSLSKFSEGFLDWLEGLRFEGDVYAVREGTPLFADEPLLEVVAPIGPAQLAETFLLNQAHLQSLLASKAARVVAAAAGRAVVDFGARRMHGLDAALQGARAFYIAGVQATSNVAAGRAYGIPVAGTMAHSFIEVFNTEIEAYRAFARSFPETVLLVDTYDSLQGVRRVIDLARELKGDFRVQAVRLDSGGLADLSKEARRMLDAAGLPQVGIFASGGLDEDKIDALVRAGAPIDGFGVGTAMGVSKDVPALDIVYKLTAYAGEGRLKLSPGKATYPGRKQIFRREENGRFAGDIIARDGESLEGRPLLEAVMRGGKRLAPAPPLAAIREYAASETAKLPPALRGLAPARETYSVTISGTLEAYRRAVTARRR